MGEFNGMPYKSLGGSGLKVSSVGLGTWKFGYPETGDASRVGREAAFRIFDRALELGVTFWDTANRYNFGTGNSERVIGEWFAAHPESRRDIVIATKLAGEMDGKTPNHAGLSRTNIIESVYASMDRMNLDHIDLLYFHWPDPTTPLEESLEAVEDLVREDLVRYFAVSNYTAEGIRDILRISGQLSRRCRPVAIQNRYDIIAKEAPDKPGVLSLCAEEGLSYIAWSPLACGLLTGRYNDPAAVGAGNRLVDENTLSTYGPEVFEKLRALAGIATAEGVTMAQLALAYMMTLPGMGPVIPAASTPEQLEQNAVAGKYIPSAEVCTAIRAIVG